MTTETEPSIFVIVQCYVFSLLPPIRKRIYIMPIRKKAAEAIASTAF